MRRFVVAIGLATMASSAAAQVPPHYVDDTAGSGISHSYEGGWEFFVGGGVAAFDCDMDGRPDLMFAGGSNGTKLYRNSSLTGGALTFTEMTKDPAGIRDVTGIYPLDIDGDDELDLVLLRVGENIVLRGRGGCQFERANEAWGFDGGEAWSTAFTAR